MKQYLQTNSTIPAKTVLLATISLCCFVACTGGTPTEAKKAPEANAVDSILKRLEQASLGLKYYQAEIKHTFSQPLLDSETLRTGRLYYKQEAKSSKVRLDFETLKQDDAKEQAYREQVLFDGVWLMRIDYQLKRAEYRQLAEPNSPMKALDLASGYLPIAGLTKTEDLKKRYVITLVPQSSSKSSEPIHLRLQAKTDSGYKEAYSIIDLWLDTKLFLPTRIVYKSGQDETEEWEFYNQNIKKKLSDSIFQVEIPDGFSKNVIKLKQKATGKSRQ
jgi:outer membrane lipoprotein-sorting protein